MAGYRSPYEILSVSPDAELIVIEAAHKALIRKYHPDLWIHDAGAQDRAATINQAFSILRDPETRSVCDQQLRAMRNAAQAASLKQARPRQRGARWWSGWLVALAIAGATIVPWGELSPPEIQTTSRTAPAPATSTRIAQAEPERPPHRAAPSGPEKPLPEGLVQMLAKAREQQSAFLVSMDETAGAAPARQDVDRQVRREAGARRYRPRQPQSANEPPEEDFLKRKDFIY